MLSNFAHLIFTFYYNMNFYKTLIKGKSYNAFIVSLAFCFSSCFNLFEKEKKTLAKINLNTQSSVEANFISTGATTKDVVQIVFIKGSYSKVIGTYQNYNWVELVKISSDSLLVKLSDSASIPNYIDTQYIKLPGM